MGSGGKSKSDNLVLALLFVDCKVYVLMRSIYFLLFVGLFISNR